MRIGAGKATVTDSTLAADNTGPTLATGGLDIAVAGTLEVNAGRIQSNALGAGGAGAVRVKAKDLTITQQGTGTLTGLFSEVEPGSGGSSGGVEVNLSGALTMRGAVGIVASSYGNGYAGDIVVEAGELRLDAHQGTGFATGIRSDAAPGSCGNAGTVTIRVTNLMEVLNGGAISSSTLAAGDAGGVEIEAGSLRINNQESDNFTGIVSQARSNSSGNAGTVAITVAGLLEVLNGGHISSSTWALGNAGSVKIHAGELVIDGQGAQSVLTDISSASLSPAQGFVGDVDIETGKLTVRNGGTISIETHQSVSEEEHLQAENAHLFINSPVVIFDQGALITAESWGNVPAAAIGIEADEIRISGNSSITTSANEANGGAITLQGKIIDLRDSLITSSVAELTGDGGDITLKGFSAAEALILEGGFVQANAPAGARGGDIYIDAKAVIPEGGALEVGGLIRRRFESGSGENIIQAAAPGGEQGTIRITSPELDISGALVNLNTRLTETIRLEADPCLSAYSPEGSSLVFAGSGGVPAGPSQHATLFFDGDRLERVLTFDKDCKGLKEK